MMLFCEDSQQVKATIFIKKLVYILEWILNVSLKCLKTSYSYRYNVCCAISLIMNLFNKVMIFSLAT